MIERAGGDLLEATGLNSQQHEVLAANCKQDLLTEI
jgi:hypothetical protein